MKRIVYDEKYHAEALLEILEMKNPCRCCPGSDAHNEDFHNYVMSLNDKTRLKIRIEACRICELFVSTKSCPCYELGKQEAIKRTWIALEEKGYLEEVK